MLRKYDELLNGLDTFQSDEISDYDDEDDASPPSPVSNARLQQCHT